MESPASSAPLNWHERAGRFAPETRPFIGGDWRAALSGKRFSDLNPATGEVLWQIDDGGPEDIDCAVRAARAAFEDGRWRSLPPLHRKAVMLNFAAQVEAHGEELALLDSLEMGKPISKALFEVVMAAGFFRYCGEAIDKIYGEVAPSDLSCLALSVREPRGVVGAITPWNYPLANAAIKLAPALAAGNSVVLKPSELAPLSALKLAEIAVRAGLPAGVLNVVPGLGRSAGEALARHGDVDLLTFTGSTATGRAILRASADSNGKPVLLECGGKSPQLVFADAADLRAIAVQAVNDAFENQGQLCVAKTRLLVERGIEVPFLAQVTAAAAAIRCGDPLDPATTHGPLASPAQKARVLGYVASGLSEGARLRHGNADLAGAGCFVSGTVFDRVDPDSRLAREEIFGPVLGCFAFADEAEAIRLANASAYGLAANVWTGDLGRALRLSRAIRAGRIQLGGAPMAGFGAAYSLSAEPVAQSGFGVEGGVAGILAYMSVKAVTLLSPALA